MRSIYMRHPRTLFDPKNLAEDVDVVVAAGDVNVPLTASLRWLAEHFEGTEIIYVAGNHDYYRAFSDDQWTIESLLVQAEREARNLRVHFLENGITEVGGVRFIGATLWSDFISIGSRPLEEKKALAAKRMTDYRQIMTHVEGTVRRLQPEDTIGRHVDSRAFLKSELAKPFTGKTVVVTHHAPFAGSLDMRFGGELDWCFASDLSEILLSPNAPDFWIHGHIHKSSDYRVGHTRIIANPRGYPFVGDHEEGRGFNPVLVIDTDAGE